MTFAAAFASIEAARAGGDPVPNLLLLHPIDYRWVLWLDEDPYRFRYGPHPFFRRRPRRMAGK